MSIKSDMMTTIGPLIALAIGIIVVTLIAGMSVIGTTSSANLLSAVRTIGQFMSILGVGIGASILLRILGKI